MATTVKLRRSPTHDAPLADRADIAEARKLAGDASNTRPSQTKMLKDSQLKGSSSGSGRAPDGDVARFMSMCSNDASYRRVKVCEAVDTFNPTASPTPTECKMSDLSESEDVESVDLSHDRSLDDFDFRRMFARSMSDVNRSSSSEDDFISAEEMQDMTGSRRRRSSGCARCKDHVERTIKLEELVLSLLKETRELRDKSVSYTITGTGKHSSSKKWGLSRSSTRSAEINRLQEKVTRLQDTVHFLYEQLDEMGCNRMGKLRSVRLPERM
mmetsp:Transcript_10187/g.31154  ORF Transcript_10187/g.31154 Transcript_10187/m.31154 type:complete len:270 (-) Transcript_10187:304-1113(-)|eukprot:CAMPEP_0198731764 /NCGR_PEP_ID=MMETSP1475-20131203/32011_1 /TAXON_ID= ORGANISM="Unidentified sp., Strain CCMP1999" /NCGR_SAMPLE_ID=MMETSP1475 /ASSEMBLY_ACC=CAM_ASM_001111 /LENGTH=269 /DNA_ID=CAMNT_0044494769 /DNA_START=242 /DNA_END=1051 /DNA_ORIENTATION=-